ALLNDIIIDYYCNEILNPPVNNTTVISTDETTTKPISTIINRAWIMKHTVQIGIVISIILAFSGILAFILKKKFF
ncbi:hypothetical protein, partial [Candidatus Hodarchaeum mangrovi]